jgi:hypothetical protein
LYVGTVPTVLFYCILVLFRQCCSIVFWYCSDSVVLLYVGTVPTVLFYCILVLFRQCCSIVFCSSSVVFVVFHFIVI